VIKPLGILELESATKSKRNHWHLLRKVTVVQLSNNINTTSTMHFSSLWACVLALFATSISATALTYKLQPNEKACFFANVAQKGAKIAFYFAVRLPVLRELPKWR
jgi:hypothetical protein